jgi:hypothetical protein
LLHSSKLVITRVRWTFYRKTTAMTSHQYSLALISRKVQDSIIEQRSEDGYINATAMCKAAGKLMADYARLASTKAYLQELASDMGIPITELMQSVQGGDPKLQGTWVHPQVAIHLAQWLSPRFAVQVSKWVHEWMSGKIQAPIKMPFHLERHLMNFHKIPSGYFSVLQEMTNALVAPMEAQGYRMPESMMPDIAHGRLLCQHLRDTHGIDTDALPTYKHEFPEGRVVDAKLYPLEYLGEFRVLLAKFWMIEKAAAYFKKRDPLALAALDKILMLGAQPPTKAISANNGKFKRKA